MTKLQLLIGSLLDFKVIFVMCTNFRLAWLVVYMVGDGWVERWGEAECSEMQ